MDNHTCGLCPPACAPDRSASGVLGTVLAETLTAPPGCSVTIPCLCGDGRCNWVGYTTLERYRPAAQ